MFIEYNIMASFTASDSESTYDVVFSYQGAFGPPTYGHYKSMEAFATKIQIDFPEKKILMLFMPTAGGSKAHLQPTRNTRKEVLDVFCEKLKISFSDITFETSEIEYNIFDKEETKGKTTTIYTINKLKMQYPNAKICLGMGIDNAYQLPYWQDIDKYSEFVEKIYVVPRKPTPEELNKTRLFNVVNKDNTTAQLRFDITVPWKNDTFLKGFFGKDTTETKDTISKDTLLNKLIEANKVNEANEDNKDKPFTFHLTLPSIVILDTSIPATSSSMMRYFIGQYISTNEDLNKEKVEKIMFSSDKTHTKLVENTITNYRDVFKGVFPVNNDYDTEYENFNKSVGGNRKTKRRKSIKKQKSQKKKRRSRK